MTDKNTNTTDDIAARVARLEQLVTNCTGCAAAMRSARDADRRKRLAAICGVVDPAERARQFRDLPTLEKRELLAAISWQAAYAFSDGLSPADVDLVLENLPPRSRQLVEIRHRDVPRMVRVSISPMWPTPSRTLITLQSIDDTVAAQLEAHGLSRLYKRDHEGRAVYSGFALDKTAQPVMSHAGFELLLYLDSNLRDLAERKIVVAESLSDDEACAALIEQWDLHSTPRSRGIELLPRKGTEPKTRNRIRRTRKRAS